MYDELVERLRYLAKVYSVCENENTNEYKLAVEAADAIEELQRKEKFHAFIWNTLGRETMMQLVDLYRGEDT